MYFSRLMLKLKLQYFGHRLIGRDSDFGRDWGQEEKGTIEDEMDEWHHQVKGHEFWQVTEDVKDREAWHVVVHGVTKNWT